MACRGQRVSSYQIPRQQRETLLIYSDLTVIKMAAVGHLGFLGIQILNCRYGSQVKYVSLSVKPLPSYGRFVIFEDGGRPPSWILKSSKF